MVEEKAGWGGRRGKWRGAHEMEKDRGKGEGRNGGGERGKRQEEG